MYIVSTVIEDKQYQVLVLRNRLTAIAHRVGALVQKGIHQEIRRLVRRKCRVYEKMLEVSHAVFCLLLQHILQTLQL